MQSSLNLNCRDATGEGGCHYVCGKVCNNMTDTTVVLSLPRLQTHV